MHERCDSDLLSARRHGDIGSLYTSDVATAGHRRAPPPHLQAAAGTPNSLRNARLNAVSVWYPTSCAISISGCLLPRSKLAASIIRLHRPAAHQRVEALGQHRARGASHARQFFQRPGVGPALVHRGEREQRGGRLGTNARSLHNHRQPYSKTVSSSATTENPWSSRAISKTIGSNPGWSESGLRMMRLCLQPPSSAGTFSLLYTFTV